MQLYMEIVLDLQDQGIECPSLGPDEIFEIQDDDDGNDGAQVIEITHDGVTSTIDREGPREIRATLKRVQSPLQAPAQGTPETIVLLRRFHRRRQAVSPEAPPQPASASSSGPCVTSLPDAPESPLGQEEPDWGEEEVAGMQELYDAAHESLHRNASRMHNHSADLMCCS